MIASLFLALAAPAPAQALVPKDVVLRRFGACLLKQAPDRAHRLLTSELGSAVEKALLDEILSARGEGCIDRAVLSMGYGQIRGAMAQAAFEREPAKLAAAEALTARAVARPEAAEGRAFVINYAQCLVAAKPAAAVTLIRSDIASKAESAAFFGFDDTLKDCMPIGVEYRVNISDVRSHVAAVLYKEAAA